MMRQVKSPFWVALFVRLLFVVLFLWKLSQKIPHSVAYTDERAQIIIVYIMPFLPPPGILGQQTTPQTHSYTKYGIYYTI